MNAINRVEEHQSVVTHMSDGSKYRRYEPSYWMRLTGLDEYTVTDSTRLEAVYQAWLVKRATKSGVTYRMELVAIRAELLHGMPELTGKQINTAALLALMAMDRLEKSR